MMAMMTCLSDCRAHEGFPDYHLRPRTLFKRLRPFGLVGSSFFLRRESTGFPTFRV